MNDCWRRWNPITLRTLSPLVVCWVLCPFRRSLRGLSIPLPLAALLWRVEEYISANRRRVCSPQTAPTASNKVTPVSSRASRLGYKYKYRPVSEDVQLLKHQNEPTTSDGPGHASAPDADQGSG
jgi:hypothetical protein